MILLLTHACVVLWEGAGGYRWELSAFKHGDDSSAWRTVCRYNHNRQHGACCTSTNELHFLNGPFLSLSSTQTVWVFFLNWFANCACHAQVLIWQWLAKNTCQHWSKNRASNKRCINKHIKSALVMSQRLTRVSQPFRLNATLLCSSGEGAELTGEIYMYQK